MGRTGPGHTSIVRPGKADSMQEGCSPAGWGASSQAPTPNPLLARPPEPVGPCLYLVTLGGFASSTGIWHPRWKISLVRSPWKQAEPLRRFTLNGARPACIRCPVSRIPSQAVRATWPAWHLTPAKGLGLRHLGLMRAALNAPVSHTGPLTQAPVPSVALGLGSRHPSHPAWPLQRLSVGHLTGWPL